MIHNYVITKRDSIAKLIRKYLFENYDKKSIQYRTMFNCKYEFVSVAQIFNGTTIGILSAIFVFLFWIFFVMRAGFQDV